MKSFKYGPGDIISESENFVAFPCLVSLAPGHLVVVSKMHYLTFSRLPSPLMREYELFLNDLLARVEAEFGAAFAFESGVWGQSIPAAHTHILPLAAPHYRLRSVRTELLEKSGKQVVAIDSVSQITEPEYIFLREAGQSYWCKTYPDKYDPSKQYLHLKFRSYISRTFGLPHLEHWEDAGPELLEADKKIQAETKRRLHTVSISQQI